MSNVQHARPKTLITVRQKQSCRKSPRARRASVTLPEHQQIGQNAGRIQVANKPRYWTRRCGFPSRYRRRVVTFLRMRDVGM